MTISSFTALPRSVFRFLFHLATSPFDYVKELMVFAAVIASASWTIGSVQDWFLNGGANAAVAAREQASISKLFVSAEDEILLFRDFCEIVAVDESGEILCQQPIFSPEYVQFARDPLGWSFLSMDRERNIFWRHSLLGEFPCDAGLPTSTIYDATLSANGMTAAVLYRGREIVLWNRTEESLPVSRSWPMDFEVDQINLSPQGGKLAIKTVDHKLRWMDTRTGAIQTPVQPDVVLPVCHAWSRDERWFATGMENRQLMVWKADSSTEPVFTTMTEGIPLGMSLSSDGRWLIAGQSTGEITAWRDGKLAWSKKVQHGGIRALDLSGDDQIIVSACMQGQLLVHSVETGELLREIKHARH